MANMLLLICKTVLSIFFYLSPVVRRATTRILVYYLIYLSSTTRDTAGFSLYIIFYTCACRKCALYAARDAVGEQPALRALRQTERSQGAQHIRTRADPHATTIRGYVQML